VLDSRDLSPVEPFGLLECLFADVVAEAERWRDHLVDIETGLPRRARHLAPGYDPQATTLAQRQRTKAAELGVGFRSIERKRANYEAQGLWGLVDQRATRTFDVAGHADARLVEVLRELIAAETDASTGTRSQLMRRAEKLLEQRHSPGTVPLPGKTAFYALIGRLAVGRHTFGSAVTRRRARTGRSGRSPLRSRRGRASRSRSDSTPIDLMVLAADGTTPSDCLEAPRPRDRAANPAEPARITVLRSPGDINRHQAARLMHYFRRSATMRQVGRSLRPARFSSATQASVLYLGRGDPRSNHPYGADFGNRPNPPKTGGIRRSFS
jgi:hypothetical protein